MRTFEERFYSFFGKTEEGCWIWNGSKDSWGYGHIIRNGKLQKAHRIAWELKNGPIPMGMKVLHQCDTPACVRPEHLFIGTSKDNAQDRNKKNRHAYGEKSGRHKLTEDDVRAIRQQYRAGKKGRPYGHPVNGAFPGSTVDLARRFNISISQAWNIAMRISWKHVH